MYKRQLTTHYLEEAQTLCNRIAMLKAGRIVALDNTANLLRAVDGHTLRVKLAGDLPAEVVGLKPERDGEHWVFASDDYTVLLDRLVALRQAGAEIAEFEVGQPDLEKVFVDVMRRAG